MPSAFRHPVQRSIITCSRKYRFVTGLEGRVSTSVRVPAANGLPAVQLNAGDLFRIRWDFDDGEKGVHVNAEFFGGQGTIGTTKIAFKRTTQPLVPGSSTLYD